MNIKFQMKIYTKLPQKFLDNNLPIWYYNKDKSLNRYRDIGKMELITYSVQMCICA